MKKVFAVLLAAIMVLAFAACGEKPQDDEPVVGPGAENPWTEYESLEALNQEFGAQLAHPGVMGISDEVFRGLNDKTIAEYIFTLSGTKYVLRFSPDFTATISGVYSGENLVFDGVTDGNLVTEVLDVCKLARWVTNLGQYVLIIEDNGEMSEETFNSAVEEIRQATIPAES